MRGRSAVEAGRLFASRLRTFIGHGASALIEPAARSDYTSDVMHKVTYRYVLSGAVALCVSAASSAQNSEMQRNPEESIGEKRDFSGVWLREFEGSTFLEGSMIAVTDFGERLDGAWFNVPDNLKAVSVSDLSFDSELGCYPVYAFAVSFIGQKREYVGSRTQRRGYGHLGVYRSRIDVIELRSIEKISGPYCYDQTAEEYFETRARARETD